LTSRDADTTATLKQFNKTINQASKDILKLKTTWEDKRTEQIVQQAKQNYSSLDQEWPSAEEVPLYGWGDKVAALETRSKQFGGDAGDDEQDLDAILEEMKDEFEEAKWVGEGHDHLQVKVKGKAIRLNFDIVTQNTKTEGRIWDATAVGRFPLTRVLKQREKKKKGDIKYLLVCFRLLFFFFLCLSIAN
jgi:hypothetical protein